MLLLSVVNAKAQMSAVPVPTPVGGGAAASGEDFTWWYISLFVLAIGLVGAVVWMMKEKKDGNPAVKTKKAEIGGKNGSNAWETGSVDANKEMEWLRKNQKLVGKSGKKASNRSGLPQSRPKKTAVAAAVKDENLDAAPDGASEAVLPIFLVERIELARPFAPLPLSNDEDLMNAVEQTQDEFEEDEQVRDIALRILQTFKTRNSIEALTQMALYDLSSNLRSKAVAVLADFNHESVFEPILQASADPTREVRAAAARALSKLTFDRADAWTRIFETEEPGRIKQSARAAIESGFVEMSFDRLVHSDKKYAYEAFALMVLLIKGGETDGIFQSIETHKNMNVRKALLHVIKVTKDERAVEQLCAMLEGKKLPLELQEEVDKTIEEIGFVTV